ncbi:alpha-amylase family glycosyl hydrolase [Roseateles chitinivorans]|uniref:alpha-amylase family glycosyl hydrolase n=1 Tax=Roseateles chitinivorans TaxID=2917965 RepID=UPI003D6724F1
MSSDSFDDPFHPATPSPGRRRWLQAGAALPLALLGGAAAASPAADQAIAPRREASSPAGGDARYAAKPYVELRHPDWARDAAIYQINLRQFTPEGTLRAAQAQLPRLQALGVGILWLMPIHPIGERQRKGALGSPYAVKDFRAVNPEFGDEADLRRFIARAHALGLRVILDWVGNHTAWDNVLVEQHPEWYARDAAGRFHPTPWYDWDDIIDLDYDQPGLRRYMTETLVYWVKAFGVDGYRVDAAGLVPLDFWEEAARQMRAVKPVFLLAEWEGRDFHARAFDATYAWTWWDALKHIVEGRTDLGPLLTYYAWARKFYPREAYRMLYTTNHDKNAWEGTEFEIFGPAVDAVTVLSFVGEGMPMLYNGQEAGNTRRLAFFERDPIVWRDDAPQGVLLKRLIALKRSHRALWNGEAGATMDPVRNDAPRQVLSFRRGEGAGRIVALFNFSAQARSVTIEGPGVAGRYADFIGGQRVDLNAKPSIDLPAWGFRVFVA